MLCDRAYFCSACAQVTTLGAFSQGFRARRAAYIRECFATAIIQRHSNASSFANISVVKL
jgi:hypothetical protein